MSADVTAISATYDGSREVPDRRSAQKRAVIVNQQTDSATSSFRRPNAVPVDIASSAATIR